MPPEHLQKSFLQSNTLVPVDRRLENNYTKTIKTHLILKALRI